MSGNSDKFFLGKAYDLEKGSMLEELIHYDPNDLTTHGVITGMTGSGKTGLGVILLEEAALQGIPAIVVDPKGDLTNLLLHFPDLLPEDFQPWIDKDAARREDVTVEQAAEKAASLWKNGLASYGLGKDQIAALDEVVDYAVYTPGSDAGMPVSILASLSAPSIPWEGNKEILREKISSTVTALLGLVGLKALDPVKSKEHILLSNIFEETWRQGKDLDMAALIMQVQSPSFDKLGVFSLDQFYPEKERFELAMLLNNFLAAPAFHTWMEGQPLDIGKILYTPSGKPRHSVFYLAHLSDEERMFFVTLLYSAIESWMRTQKGASGLRALVYFDEIAGYLPPVANPPSKNIILRMLKQARAFGVGLVLATQNPVDLDYKALSNAGTWMIGKLQTDQDKQRLLDGLEGAAPGLDRNVFDRMISRINKRVFLLHNVHESAPQVFHTRWAMNYLPGPLTRAQIPAVNALVDAKTHSYKGSASTEEGLPVKETGKLLGNETPPPLPGSVPVYYHPVDRGLSDAIKDAGSALGSEVSQPEVVYHPMLVGQARVAYLERKYNISHEAVYAVRIDELRRKGLVRWDNFIAGPVDVDRLSHKPLPNVSFETLDTLAVEDGKFVSDLQKDFEDWIYRTQTMILRVNEALGVVAGPEDSDEDFRKMCDQAIEKKVEEEIEASKEKFNKNREALLAKLKKEEVKLEENENELSHRRVEELGKGVETVLGLLSSRRRSISSSLTKRRMTSNAKIGVEESEKAIEALKKEVEVLDREMAEEVEKIPALVRESCGQVVELPVAPFKKNIFVEVFGVLWLPYYAFPKGDGWVTVPAFEWKEEKTG